MSPQKKILYVCQQVAPYIVDEPQADRCNEMLHAMNERGGEVRTFMPRYGVVNERRNQLHSVNRLSGMPIVVDGADHTVDIKVASLPSSRMQIYFIESDDYFVRKAVLKDDKGKQFKDNDVRTKLFAKGVLKAVNMLRWEPDVIHCHGWFAAFAAVYVKQSFSDDPIYANTKVVVSLDADTFEGELNKDLQKLLLEEGFAAEAVDMLAKPTYENFVKFVINYADGVVISAGDVDEKVAKIARQSGKPIFEQEYKAGENEAKDYYDNYAKFYDKI
ncbi:MAG: glycogen/starch synthase [Rikenellaceae bacterium]